MPSRVYLARFDGDVSEEGLCRKTRDAFAGAGCGERVAEGQFCAVKTHFGEVAETAFIPPAVIKTLVDEVREAGGEPLLVETSTLYRGRRHNAVGHFYLAEEHGFGHSAIGCPLLFLDGLRGGYSREVEVGLKHYKTVAVAGDFPLIPSAVVATHLTGHGLAGLGGAIKNVAMGLASRAGKLRMHETGHPAVLAETCKGCGTCAEWCPADAIEIDGVARIDYEECIGCGECLAICPVGAIGFTWSERRQNFSEKLAEFACGILKGKESHVTFLTYILQTARDCDCGGGGKERVCPDLGILVSDDLVAIDQAAVDLVNEATGTDLFGQLWPDTQYTAQLIHGEAIGLGSRRYELIEL